MWFNDDKESLEALAAPTAYWMKDQGVVYLNLSIVVRATPATMREVAKAIRQGCIPGIQLETLRNIANVLECNIPPKEEIPEEKQQQLIIVDEKQ